MSDEMTEIKRAAEWFENRAKTTPMPGARRMFELAAESLRDKANGVTAQEWISVSANPPVAYQVEWMHETKDTALLLYSRAHRFVCGWYLGVDSDGVHLFETDESLYGGEEILSDVTNWMPIPELPKGE